MVDLDRLERVLIQAARGGPPGDLRPGAGLFRLEGDADHGGRAVPRPRPPRRRADRGEGWPDLACLVVRKSDGLPGEGYFSSLRSEGAYAGPSVGPAAAKLVTRQAQRSCLGDAASRLEKV